MKYAIVMLLAGLCGAAGAHGDHDDDWMNAIPTPPPAVTEQQCETAEKPDADADDSMRAECERLRREQYAEEL